MPIPVVLLAAYGWGYREGFFAALFTAGTILMADVIDGATPGALRTGLLASIVVIAAAVVGGYTRQLWLEAEERERETADEVGRMALANDLFHALHDVVRTLPDSLDLAEVVASGARHAARRLRPRRPRRPPGRGARVGRRRTQAHERGARPPRPLRRRRASPARYAEALDDTTASSRSRARPPQTELWNSEFATTT